MLRHLTFAASLAGALMCHTVAYSQAKKPCIGLEFAIIGIILEERHCGLPKASRDDELIEYTMSCSNMTEVQRQELGSSLKNMRAGDYRNLTVSEQWIDQQFAEMERVFGDRACEAWRYPERFQQ